MGIRRRPRPVTRPPTRAVRASRPSERSSAAAAVASSRTRPRSRASAFRASSSEVPRVRRGRSFRPRSSPNTRTAAVTLLLASAVSDAAWIKVSNSSAGDLSRRSSTATPTRAKSSMKDCIPPLASSARSEIVARASARSASSAPNRRKANPNSWTVWTVSPRPSANRVCSLTAWAEATVRAARAAAMAATAAAASVADFLILSTSGSTIPRRRRTRSSTITEPP